MATVGEVCVLICNLSDLDCVIDSFASVDRITCVSIFFLHFELKHSSTYFFQEEVLLKVPNDF